MFSLQKFTKITYFVMEYYERNEYSIVCFVYSTCFYNGYDRLNAKKDLDMTTNPRR